MKKTCPECGSSEIISDLIVFADEMLAGQLPVYVQLTEPKPEKTPFIWVPKSAESGLRATICGECGYTRLHATNHAALLQARKQGYESRPNGTSRLKA